MGYWVVPAGVTLRTPRPTFPSFGANGVFSMGIVPGKYTLVVRGVDGSGHFGLPAKQILVAEQNPLNPPATGDLVVTLTWDTESDLDLHVVDPVGVDIYWGNQSDEPPLPGSVPPTAGSYGYVDYDSNARLRHRRGFAARTRDLDRTSPRRAARTSCASTRPTLCGQPIRQLAGEGPLARGRS